MPYCPYLKVKAFDAEFVFGGFDKAFSKVASIAVGTAGEIDTSSLNEEQFAAFIDVFAEGLVSWHGVVDMDGQPIPCTKENKISLLTPMHKVHIIELLFEIMQKIDEKKEASSGTPFNATDEA